MRNASHANRGRDWELLIDGWHDRYRLEGRAVVYRTPPPTKVLSWIDKGVFRACFLGLGPPDYAGVVARFGPSAAAARAVAFDAKDCGAARWKFEHLEPHQARDLDEWARLGGIAFIALRLAGRGWVLPWSELGPRWSSWSTMTGAAVRGTASVGVEELQQWALPMPQPGDWLGAIL
jgi:penicillin-binding protein-related factor A (putative recombinase)